MMEPRAKILIIDDDFDFVHATRKVLESVPYEVIVAFDGEEGLQKAREEKPDLILLDIIMPLRDGFTVCDELKSSPEFAQVPILMLTSFSQRWQRPPWPWAKVSAWKPRITLTSPSPPLTC
jgi:DNA-binding response OmpR family regulator